MAGKPRFLWEKRPLEATAGLAHLQLQVDKCLQCFLTSAGPRGSPKIVLASARPFWPAPHCRGSHSAFQLPSGARCNRVGRVIFPGLASRFPACRALSERHLFLPRSPGPEAPAASEPCAGLRPARTLTALHAAVVRVWGWRVKPPGVPTEGFSPPRFPFGGQIALTPNHQQGGNRWLIAQNRVSCKRLTLQQGDLVSLRSFCHLKKKVPPFSLVEGGERLSAVSGEGCCTWSV